MVRVRILQTLYCQRILCTYKQQVTHFDVFYSYGNVRGVI